MENIDYRHVNSIIDSRKNFSDLDCLKKCFGHFAKPFG